MNEYHLDRTINDLWFIHLHVHTLVLTTEFKINWKRNRAVVHILLGVIDVYHPIEPWLKPKNWVDRGEESRLVIVLSFINMVNRFDSHSLSRNFISYLDGNLRRITA